MNDPDELFRSIARHAKALRESGVTRVKIEGCEVELAPALGDITEARPSPDRDEEYSDPLEDPATFGMGNGKVPGYRRSSSELDE